jgi:Vacuolar sorting protein 9 (VPS9) domain
VESLGARVYPEPPTIEKLSDIFQDFYVKASIHISTHIATLALRVDRDSSPSRDASKVATALRPKQLARKASRDSTASFDSTVEHQMLTASEVAEKKKARKLLEYKRLALEESVERRACDRVYNKIWRHKSTLDDVRDEKLRSKTAALALVGIGLRDLGIELDQQSTSTEDDIRHMLAPARDELARMNEEKSPLGKLQRLTIAHKTIVDTLSTIHPTSSSADEILPTLIYTLITSPPEGINIISNLSFVERFRTSSKIDGEAAYCMTNLEAAIVFLENVDLASLREDELPQGPPKSPSRPATPAHFLQTNSLVGSSSSHSPAVSISSEKLESADASTMMPPTSRPTLATAASPASAHSSPPRPRPAPPLHQRRVSNLLNPPAKAIGAANDVVRNTAEEGLKNIGNTLDNSFKFLFGRLREHTSDESRSAMPQTLEDARKLVSQPLILDENTISETSSIAEKDVEQPMKQEDKLLGMIGGRLPSKIRERSVDSVQSNGSDKRKVSATANPSSFIPAPTTPNALESVKNLSTSLNPLSHLGSAFGGGFRGFGKPTATPPLPADKEKTKTLAVSLGTQNALEPSSIDPPIQRFIDLKDVAELTVREVSILLSDYQRLAKVVQQSGRI